MQTPPPSDLKDRIRDQALAFGFDACGFASAADAWPAGARLAAFVEAERHGSMQWMETTAERRAHPQAMWPDARSAVVLGVNYGPDRDPRAAQADGSAGAISVYAQGDDYHEVIKARLKSLARWMAAELPCEVKVFVDTAPLMEKPLAERAGVGWQGKHTNLVSRDFGSWLFLGVVLTSLEITPDVPGGDACGSCTACMAACPTDAFPAPYQIDARRCLSYLTIEHAGPWPEEFRVALGNRIYGCDDCLAACPWNKFAQTAQVAAFHARDELRSPALADLAALDDAAFRALFRKSPVKRIGRDRFLRNVLYAIGNSGDPSLAGAAQARLYDDAEVVRRRRLGGGSAWRTRGMSITITAFERSPDGGRGLARDTRVRWALEEVGQPYDVRLVSFAAMKEPAHMAVHPFGQIPTYEEGDLALFETGAIVFHIAQRFPGLLPIDADARARAVAWMFASVNTVEPPILDLQTAKFLEGDKPWTVERLPLIQDRIRTRLGQLSRRLGEAEWLDGEFSAGDLMMASVLLRLRMSGLLDEYPNLAAYVERGEARPAYKRAFDAQWAINKPAD